MKTMWLILLSIGIFVISLLQVGCFNFDGDDGSDTDSDTATANDTGDSDDSTCTDEDCPECEQGPCCDENGKFKKPAAGFCGQVTEYRCMEGVCGANREFRTVDVFCSGSSAECDGETSGPSWTPMAECESNEICNLDGDGAAICQPCGEDLLCGDGSCVCEFEDCFGECCAEEQICHWSNQCGDKEVKLFHPDDKFGTMFGIQVAISGDRSVVAGLEGEESKLVFYIYERKSEGQWVPQYKLVPSDGSNFLSTGKFLSMSGDRVIVGDSSNNQNGAAYIFERDKQGDWIERPKLIASDGAAGDGFGFCVGIGVDRAIVGAHGNGGRGAAYVFERNSLGDWVQSSKLIATDGEPGDSFGSSVSISGDRAIVGVGNKEAAYIFERDSQGGWDELSKLIASDGKSADGFGASVSINGVRAIVGASAREAAYVFERNSNGDWVEKALFNYAEESYSNLFGHSASIDGEHAVVGAWGDGQIEPVSGAVYIFRRESDGKWKERKKLLEPDGQGGAMFGISVSIGGSRVIIGAHGKEPHGAAFIY